jgi:hypothetical protein
VKRSYCGLRRSMQTRVDTRAISLIKDTISGHTLKTEMADLRNNGQRALEATVEAIAIADTVGIETLRMAREEVEVVVVIEVIAADEAVAGPLLRPATGVLTMLTGMVRAKLAQIRTTKLMLIYGNSQPYRPLRIGSHVDLVCLNEQATLYATRLLKVVYQDTGVSRA